MNILIAFFTLGFGYVLGVKDGKEAIRNYFVSLGYNGRESSDMAKKIIKMNGEI